MGCLRAGRNHRAPATIHLVAITHLISRPPSGFEQEVLLGATRPFVPSSNSLECVCVAGVRFQASLDLAGSLQPIPEVHRKEVPMPTTKQFTIHLEDRPGTLGKLCQALAEQSVNILAFHSCPLEKGKSTVHLVLDNPSVAKSILDRQKTDYAETEVAKVTLTHRPGELARAAARLGETRIHIHYSYS